MDLTSVKRPLVLAATLSAAASALVVATATTATAAAPITLSGASGKVGCYANGATMSVQPKPVPGAGYSHAYFSVTAAGLVPGGHYSLLVEDDYADPQATTATPMVANASGALVVKDAAAVLGFRTDFHVGENRSLYFVKDYAGGLDDRTAPFISVTVATNSQCDTLATGSPQDRLTSASKQVSLIQQSDGNLVLRRGAAAVWNSGTVGHPGAYTALQSDGNVVVRSAAGAALWSSRTNGRPGAVLTVRDDGHWVVLTGSTVRFES